MIANITDPDGTSLFDYGLLWEPGLIGVFLILYCSKQLSILRPTYMYNYNNNIIKILFDVLNTAKRIKTYLHFNNIFKNIISFQGPSKTTK